MKTNKLFNLNAMARALCEKKVTKIEFRVYAVVFILFLVSSFFTSPDDYASPFVFYAYIVSMIIFTLALLSIAYVVNKKGDNKDFWYRFISLDMTITIIFIAAIFGIALFAPIFIDPAQPIVFGWTFLIFTNSFSIVYLYLMYKYMRCVSSGCKNCAEEKISTKRKFKISDKLDLSKVRRFAKLYAVVYALFVLLPTLVSLVISSSILTE